MSADDFTEKDLSLLNDFPIFLFPVRLETRYNPSTSELWVRIYPDQISINSHIEKLTVNEYEAGKRFFSQINGEEAEIDEEEKKQAWRQLASHFGPKRAAWIIESFRQDDDLIDMDPSEFSSQKPSDPPKAVLLPDYFVVRLYVERDELDETVENRTISGKVVSEDNSFSLAGVNIHIKGTSRGTTTDADGNYKLEIPVGEKVVLVYSYLGYKTQEVEFEYSVSGTITKKGKSIPGSLPVMWKLTQESENEELFDENAKWVMDFEEALNVGMAVKIPLEDPRIFKNGISKIVAIGVKSDSNAAESVQLVEDLFEAHHYTDGLSFLENGTPTNNTRNTKSGYSKSSREIEKSYDIELSPQHSEETKRTNANCISKALGINKGDNGIGTLFAHVENAGNRDLSYSEEMLSALWPVTWSYYLSFFNQKSFIPNEEKENLKQHFTRFTNAQGPFPLLRIGNIPYGVLPVSTISDGWKHSIADWYWITDVNERDKLNTIDSYLYTILKNLYNEFLKMAIDPDHVPRIGTTDDPDQELLQFLAMEPSSVSNRCRYVFDDSFIIHLLSFVSPVSFGSETIFDVEGISQKRWIRNWISKWQDGQSENIELFKNILDLDDIKFLNNWPILRTFLWGRGHTLTIPLVATDDYNSNALTETDGIDLGDDNKKWLVGGLFRKLIDFSLNQVDDSGKTEIKNNLSELKTGLSDKKLEDLFRSCLDLSTHRLDAWITSLATRRLYAMRYQENGYHEGIYIGAYGWVENLKIGDSRLSPEVVSLRSGDTETSGHNTGINEIYEGGYIHAPSIGQATAAAVLRSAYLSYSEDGIPEAAKINLSSSRVRMALRLIDGVRQGQPLGALLGYQFERGLHDRSLDSAIDIFRNLFPLKAGKENEMQENETAESVAARNVVDGCALAIAWREADPQLPETLSDDLDGYNEGLEGELDKLLEALDAVNDLWFNEAIYQGTQGRYERMGAALDANSGIGPVPEVESVRSPRSGHSNSYRLCMIFNEVSDNANSTNRAKAEPTLNSYVSEILGNLDEIEGLAWIPSQSDEPIKISLGNLDIDPLDFVFMAKTTPTGEDSELEQLIRYKIRKDNDNVSQDDKIKLNLFRSDSNSTDLEDEYIVSRSIGEAVEIALQLIKIIGNATILKPSMLCMPEMVGKVNESENNGNIIGVFSDTVYQNLVERYDTAYENLEGLKNQQPNEDNVDELCEYLESAFSFGIPDAIPSNLEDPVELFSQKKAVEEEIERRLKKAEDTGVKAEDHAEDNNYEKAVSELQDAMKALFGNSFTTLPVFKAKNHSELQNALNTDILGDQGTERIWRWMQQTSATHPSVEQFETTTMLNEAWQNTSINNDTSCDDASDFVVDETAVQNLKVIQLPFRNLDRWTALSKDEYGDLSEEEIIELENRPQGSLSIVFHSTNGSIDFSQPISGILIDQWEERIPNREEITGVSFNYDQPNSQAPQSLLLAVPGEWDPEEESHWKLEDLFDIVHDTMDLAKVRSVDLDAIKKLGQFLPALYFPKAVVNNRSNGESPTINNELNL